MSTLKVVRHRQLPEVEEVDLDLEKFEEALREGECDVVDSMLAQGYIPNPDSIEIVCREGNIDLLHRLLQFPMDIQAGMEAAVRHNHIDLLNCLYLQGGDVNLPDKDGVTLLHCVTEIEACQWLLDMGARQVPNNNGETPLHWVCEHDNVELVKLLLSREDGMQSLTHLANDNSTPLHLACGDGTMAVELLLTYDQVVQTLTQVDNEGYTPLNWACHNEIQSAAKLILSHDQGVQSSSIPNNEGNTPLHEACINNDCETAELLLKFREGIRTIHKHNKKGLTPLDIAYKNKNKALVNLMLF